MNITKENALKIKGFAIILMIIHHSFGFPSYWIDKIEYPSLEILGETSFHWINTITKVCVAIFAFLTGYAYFYNQTPTVKEFPKKDCKVSKKILAHFIWNFNTIILYMQSWSNINF